MKVKTISNEDVKEILIGTPAKHKHLRTLIKIEEDWFIFSEATIANLVRAYIEIKTHPKKNSVLLKQERLTNQKKNFAAFQLLEQSKSEEELDEKFNDLWASLIKQAL